MPALLLAAQKNHVEVAQLLLGANCNMYMAGKVKYGQDCYCITPFKYAIMLEYWRFAEVMVMAGYDLTKEKYLLTNEDVPQTLVLNFDFWGWLIQSINNPRTLKTLCRNKVRHLIGRMSDAKVEMLPLPKRLQSMLMLKVDG